MYLEILLLILNILDDNDHYNDNNWSRLYASISSRYGASSGSDGRKCPTNMDSW